MSRVLTLSLILVLTVACETRADWQIWTTTQTRHILREEGPPPDARPAVSLAAARNETRGFQILLRSELGPTGVTIEPGDLRGPDDAVLHAADAVLYRQHQIEITVPTSRNERFQPGWYPDPLIPFRHPLTKAPLKAARLVATPFDLATHQTHGFWVDISIPANAKPGEYRGTYRVLAAEGPSSEVPVSLTVWDFALPATPTLQTEFGSPAQRMRGYYRERAKERQDAEPKDWQAVESQCAQLLAEHRLNATPATPLSPAAQPDGSYQVPAVQVAALREFVDQYHINALPVPSPRSVFKDPQQDRVQLEAWFQAWDRAIVELDRPQVTFYIYLYDEPNDEAAYRTVRAWGQAIRATRTKVKVLVVEQPQPQQREWGDLYGAVDIWCPLFSLFEAEPAAQRQALGETIWTYTALTQGRPTPWWHLDYPLLNYRVPAWIAWRYRIRGLLYWGGMAYWKEVDDPWVDPHTYGKKNHHVFNGEGTIVYPGWAVGYDGIAPSLRLKALRDSIQDYEYLAILDRAGRAAEAEKIVLPLAGSWYEWEQDPAAFDVARVQLATLIVASGGRGAAAR